MTPPKKKVPAKPQSEGRFARLRREADQMRKANGGTSINDLKPYVIDDVDPPVVIQPPGLGELLEMAEITDGNGIAVKNIRRAIRLLCGDSYDDVLDLVRNADGTPGDEYDLVAILNDIRSHFTPGAGSDDVPGK